jgi:RNA 2',3'-cyclic 3'-phosphodiesterase
MHALAPHAGKPLRLFIALWPGEALQQSIAAWQQAWSWPPHAAPVKAERLHLTLHFLGNVAAARLPKLAQAMRVPFEPFTLTFGQPEVWPNGVAVVLPDRAPAALLRLHAALGRELAALDLPVDERPYRAHVTLARRAHGAKPPPQGPNLRWRIEEGFVLVRSLPGGAGYQVLERFK